MLCKICQKWYQDPILFRPIPCACKEDDEMTELKEELEKFAKIADELAKAADDSMKYNGEELSATHYEKLKGEYQAYTRMAAILRDQK